MTGLGCWGYRVPWAFEGRAEISNIGIGIRSGRPDYQVVQVVTVVTLVRECFLVAMTRIRV